MTGNRVIGRREESSRRDDEVCANCCGSQALQEILAPSSRIFIHPTSLLPHFGVHPCPGWCDAILHSLHAVQDIMGYLVRKRFLITLCTELNGT